MRAGGACERWIGGHGGRWYYGASGPAAERYPAPTPVWKRLLLGLGLAALVLVWLASRLDRDAVWSALRDVRWELLLLAAVVQALGLRLKAERWIAAIAAGRGDRPHRRAFAATVIGNAGNLLFPARLGDVARALVLRRHNDVSASQALIAGWSVQIFDLVTLAVLVLLSGSALLSTGAVAAAAVAGAGLLAILALVQRHPQRALRLEAAVLRGPRAAGLRERLERSREGLRFLGHGRSLAMALGLTLAIWLCDVASTVAALRAFGIPAGLAAAALLVAAAGVSFALPLTPGNVGVFQAVCVLVLVPFGVARERAFAFGLGAQAFSLALSVLWGLILLQREGLDLRSLSEQRLAAPRES